ncbi:methyl-accepting chemotaxis protein [Hydrogenivirga sp. 128-5-R1-1]|uniref:methyl-accepting chemotaxis protein n=1 Tax=Hydrogenivirga sp. 128-5-R1-1 TaxID=392423 RepID=UPI00015F18D5|nr:methyl-accepting chemotaxis protein [Hydrogenivirga sp. 128-5-R1-1]EDP75516.1 methyl-accepting chemotaxis sensory transducer [Hydrogenivirga sp. 128-5-R1-1]
MELSREEEFLKLTEVILNTARATSELLESASMVELDQIFGGVLEKLNTFFKKVEESFRDFVIFERYTTCAYTSELGYGLRDIPPEVKERVWELRDSKEVCGFTGEECKCKKSIDYLKHRFSEKIQALLSSGDVMRSSSRELREGIEELGKEVESLTVSAKKIMNIAEIIEIIALNAYIEAARLGEEGRGFKVIADEVRRASVRTNELASEIIESIRLLHERFSRQLEKQTSFDESMGNLEREQREFSEKLNRDLLWMAQNFVDFLDYVRNSVQEDMRLLEDVRQTILSVLQTIDLTNQRMQNTHKALGLLSNMIEDFERVLKGEKSVEDAYAYIQSLYEEFKRIPKLRDEREVIARAEGNRLDHQQDIVGEKLEDTDTDIELF